MAQLELKEISVQFGGLLALSKLSFTIGNGRIIGLIGPNGAGKTTVFNVLTGGISGFGRRRGLNGESIKSKRPYVIFEKGIARTFQNIRLFSAMTAVENAMVARHCRTTKRDFRRYPAHPIPKTRRDLDPRKSAVCRCHGLDDLSCHWRGKKLRTNPLEKLRGFQFYCLPRHVHFSVQRHDAHRGGYDAVYPSELFQGGFNSMRAKKLISLILKNCPQWGFVRYQKAAEFSQD